MTVDVDELAEAVAEAVARKLAEIPRERPLLSVEQAAVMLGVGERTAQDMIAKGEIPSFKVRGRRVVDPEEVDRFIAACKAEEA